MADENREPKRELTAIRPSKVSLVDDGANGQFFFIAKQKSKEEETEEPSLKAAVQGFVQNVLSRLENTREWLMQAETDDEAEMPVPIMSLMARTSDELADMAETIKAGGNRLADAKVPGSQRDKMVSVIDVVAEKLSTAVVKITDEDEEICAEFVEDIEVIVDSFGAVVGKSVESEEEVEEAVWSTAYVNTLPDSAFFYIKPGGEKDEEGKTVPRTNRMFPYKDDTGKIDLPHLRNAIARIPQSNLSQDLKDQLQAKARKILEEETEKSTEGSEEEEMSVKFVEVAKSAEKVELDFTEVAKQVSAASDVLSVITGALGVDTEEAKRMDQYDLRWKIGEALDILVRAAKLEDMVSSVSKQEEPTEEEEEEGDEMTDEEMSAAEEKAADEPAATDAPAATDKPVAKSVDTDDLLSKMSDIVAKAVTPIAERLDSIETASKETIEKVEKMERARSAPKGETTDESPSNGDGGGETEGVFASIMPPHLRGKATLGD